MYVVYLFLYVILDFQLREIHLCRYMLVRKGEMKLFKYV